MSLLCSWSGPHWLTEYYTDWFDLLVDFIGWSLIHLFIECRCSGLDPDPTDWQIPILIDSICWLTSWSLIHLFVKCGCMQCSWPGPHWLTNSYIDWFDLLVDWLFLDSFIHWMSLQCSWPGPNWLTNSYIDWFDLLVDWLFLDSFVHWMWLQCSWPGCIWEDQESGGSWDGQWSWERCRGEEHAWRRVHLQAFPLPATPLWGPQLRWEALSDKKNGGNYEDCVS